MEGVWASVFWMQNLHCLQNLFSIYLYVKVFHVKLTISFQVSWTDSKLNCTRGNYKYPRQGDIRRRNAHIMRSLCIKRNSTTFKSRSGQEGRARRFTTIKTRRWWFLIGILTFSLSVTTILSMEFVVLRISSI